MSFSEIDFSQPWLIWGIILIVGFPMLVVGLGESIHHLEKQRSPYKAPTQFLQRFLLPQLVFFIILVKALDLPVDNVFVKINETLLWVFIIFSTISFFNLLVFNSEGKHAWQIQAPRLLLDVIRVILVAVGTAIVLSNVWGFELGKMLAALGVGSIVLGLALQDTLSSLFAGFSLLSSSQLKEGDWLKIGDHIGKVVHVSWRTTTILNRDEDIILVPNSDLAKSQVVNFSHPYPRHVERVNFDFSFDDSPYKVKQVLLESARNTPGILSDPPPAVDLISYDEFSVRHQVRFWIAGYTNLPQIRDEYMSSIWYLAKRRGLTFPTRAHEVTMLPAEVADEFTTDDIFERLNESTLWRNKDPLILQEMASNAKVLHFGKGDAIIRQNEDSDDFFMLLEGKAHESYADAFGVSHKLNELAPGDFCGLISLVRNCADEFSVFADIDSVAISIDETSTNKLLLKHPEIAEQIETMIEVQHFELEKINNRVLKVQSEEALHSPSPSQLVNS